MLQAYAGVRISALYIQYWEQTLIKHLVTCLERGRITPFPCISEQSINSDISKETISVFCSCRMPEEGRMIQCTKCKEWFHRQCAGLVPRIACRFKECIWHCGRCKNRSDFYIYCLYDMCMLCCICCCI